MKMTLQSRAIGVALLLALLATQGSYACYNEPPVAYISDWYQIVGVGDRIQLDGTGSYDPDGCLISFSWSYPWAAYNVWGENWSRFACNIDTPGVYYFDLTVTDNDWEQDNDWAEVKVIGIASLLPDDGVEVDDGDNNPNTKRYFLFKADSGTVTVNAIPDPGVEEWELPSSWSLTGGIGSSNLVRTVGKTMAGTT
ncbi:MAG: hypothetical protein FJ280_25415 [Planctomycetes bacterium]|nr:hypothetical protein [Planctomycetota bacterium]